MNKTCTHCGKRLPSNDYRINISIRTVMGQKLYERWLSTNFRWEGINEDFYVCNECYKEIIHFMKNEPIKKIQKHKKEFDCPDCSLNIETCIGCPRYKNYI